MQLWILASLIGLLANTAKVLTIKHLCRKIDSRLLVLCSRLFAAAILIPMLFILGHSFPLSPTFWIVLVITSCLTAVASILLTDAIRFGRLAAVMPMQASVPVFMLLVILIACREMPKSISVFFIILTAAAIAFTLYENAAEKAASSPRRVFIFTLFSLIAAFLCGITTVLDRVAIAAVAAGALAYSGWWNLVSSGILFGECIRSGSFKKPLAPGSTWKMLLFAALSVIAFFFQQLAVQKSLSTPGGVVNVKTIIMLHLPLVIAANYLLFAEKTSKKVLIGGLAAIAFGIALIRSQL